MVALAVGVALGLLVGGAVGVFDRRGETVALGVGVLVGVALGLAVSVGMGHGWIAPLTVIVAWTTAVLAVDVML